MPYRVHTKIDGKDVVFTTAVVEADHTDITSDKTPALAGDIFRPPAYGDDAAAELTASGTKPKKATTTSGGN
jgi:hypothetical protein